MRQWNNLYEVTRYSIKQTAFCGCNSPLSAPLGSGPTRLCKYHEGMENGIDMDRNQEIWAIIESFYEEGVIDKNARDLIIKELEQND